jgi:low affinity Fe/Cu permease
MPFLETGLLVAALAAVVLSLLAALLILLPLLRLTGVGGRWMTLLYFGGLGLGYMWVELAMIHRFVLYLGQPVYAAALVVGVLLVGSGVGSALSGRLNVCRAGRWSGTVACSVALMILLLGPLLQMTLSWSLAARAGVAVLLLLPLAVLMGMPFPLGLRRLGQLRSQLVPWAWGINGCLSVVGAALATLLAIEVGFSLLLLLAAVAYMLPATVRWRLPV